MMRRIFALTILTGGCFCLLGQQAEDAVAPKSMPKPVVPYYDWNVCPGEGCVYGKWITRKPVTVFNTYKQARRQITKLKRGDTVFALTGVVITFKPGVIRMDRDFPERGLQRGDTILTYAYRGEGDSAVWLKGQYDPGFDISFTKWPHGGGCGGAHCAATYLDEGVKAWWAEIKLASGKLGWIDMDTSDFAGVCALDDSPW